MAARRREISRGIVVERSSCSLCHSPGLVAVVCTTERNDFKLCFGCVWTAALQLLCGRKRPHRDSCSCMECDAWVEANTAPPAAPAALPSSGERFALLEYDSPGAPGVGAGVDAGASGGDRS